MPDKLVDSLNITLTDEQQAYLDTHLLEKRTVLAKKLGISKIQLCYRICDMQKMSEVTKTAISKKQKGNQNARKAVKTA